MSEVSFTVNGQPYRIRVEPRSLLSDALREQCGLPGTHVGCEHGVCGSCTILDGGQPVRSCLMLAVQADGREFTTVEGLGTPGELSPLQQAFRAEHGLQCGFCTPGILLTLKAHLAGHPEASEAELRDVLSGSLCRCTGYQNIVAAALRAAGHPAAELPAASGENAEAGPESPLGAAVARREDARLLTGTATFTDDLTVPG
ncbi:MAG: (2Fe-2S)-binding protein, partial [Actinobacteria bacterium]|nr:(2Fe-2S)-binding protein [Actinomycetota bacterium]